MTQALIALAFLVVAAVIGLVIDGYSPLGTTITTRLVFRIYRR